MRDHGPRVSVAIVEWMNIRIGQTLRVITDSAPAMTFAT